MIEPAPRHPLALIGSHEFEPWQDQLDDCLLSSARTGDGSVLVVPTAAMADEDGEMSFALWGVKGLEHYRRRGIPATLAPVRTRRDAFDPEAAASVGRSSIVFFSGGSPSYLANTLRGSPFWDAIRARLDDGAGLAGCSAGACLLGASAPCSVTTDLRQSHVWTPGLELLPGTLIIPHWDAIDGHRPGLTDTVRQLLRPDQLLVAIDERTALCFDGTGWRVVGEGRVTFRRGEHEVSLPTGAIAPGSFLSSETAQAAELMAEAS